MEESQGTEEHPSGGSGSTENGLTGTRFSFNLILHRVRCQKVSWCMCLQHVMISSLSPMCTTEERAETLWIPMEDVESMSSPVELHVRCMSLDGESEEDPTLPRCF